MLYPSINELLERVDSRYTLVILASKRAREIIAGDETSVDVATNKPVTKAIHEIYEGNVSYTRAPENNDE